jgi:hypothetical protein
MGFFPGVSAAQSCHAIVPVCSTDASCLADTTSLPPVSPFALVTDGYDTGSACGTKACYVIFRCTCGVPLGNSLCGPGIAYNDGCDLDDNCDDGGGGGGAGGGFPCDPEDSACFNSAPHGSSSKAASKPAAPSTAFAGCDNRGAKHSLGELNKMLATRDAGPQAASTPWQPALYVPPVAKSGGADHYLSMLDQVRRFYEAVNSLELEASAWIWLPERSGRGTVEYAVSGDRYRFRTTTDRGLGLTGDVEMAYDLEHYQLFLVDMASLSLYSQTPDRLPSPLPNPFFLPAAFLGLEDDACHACLVTLGKVTSRDRWQSRMSVAFAADGGAGGGRALIVPGSQLQGEPYFYRLSESPDGKGVGRIEMVRPNGHVFGTLTLDRYRPIEGSSQLFPRLLVFAVFDEAGGTAASISYSVTKMRLNAAVDQSVFRVPFEKARMVIDEDAHSFLKHPSLPQSTSSRQEPN